MVVRVLVLVAAFLASVTSAPTPAFAQTDPRLPTAVTIEGPAILNRIPPLHISGETRIRLREAAYQGPRLGDDAIRRALEVVRLEQSGTPSPSRAETPDRILHAVIGLTILAASTMVILLGATWLFLRRRRES